MVTRKSASSTGPAPENDAESDASEAARHNIWLAGLGAFAKAQAEGTKAFEALVSEGVELQRKTQVLAQARLTEATQQFETLAARASNVATERLDKLESIFEQRVARALTRMGIPTSADLERLSERLDALEQAIEAGKSASEKAETVKRPRAARKTD